MIGQSIRLDVKKDTEMRTPLNGLKVLDLSRALAGPFCTMILGDLGADVVKIEPLPDGEMSRTWGPFDRETSTYFLSVNRNKRSVAINFREPEGLELLRAMSEKADILVENFRPGVMSSMGLDYDRVASSNQHLIYASITAFGQGGPCGDWSGFDQIAQGMSGLMSITGSCDTGPVRSGIPIGDLVAGMWAALGVQAAVIDRNISGTGQRVDTSLLGSLIGMLCVQGQRHLSLGEVPSPVGSDHPVICPYGMFQASDGPFNLAAATQAMWRKLCDALGDEALANDPRFVDNSARFANRSELRSRLNGHFGTRTREEWTKTFNALGLPAGPILNIAEALNHPQAAHQRLVEEIEHPKLGAIRQLANPVRLQRVDRSVRTPPPLFGADTFQALIDFGIPRAHLKELAARGLIMQRDDAIRH